MRAIGHWMVVGGCALLACCSGDNAKIREAFTSQGREILDAPDTLEFYTIDPSHEDFDPKRPGTLHGYRILGKTLITDPDLRRKLVAGLYDAVTHDNTLAAACFNPRHAIHATRGGKSVDVIICFECLGLQTFADAGFGSATINNNAEPLFEQVAKNAGLPAATRPAL